MQGHEMLEYSIIQIGKLYLFLQTELHDIQYLIRICEPQKFGMIEILLQQTIIDTFISDETTTDFQDDE